MQYPNKDLFAEMEFQEFLTLLSGIMPETPLGKMIQIRSETDSEILKHYSSEQKQMRDDWLEKQRIEKMKSMTEEEKQSEIRKIQDFFAQAFG